MQEPPQCQSGWQCPKKQKCCPGYCGIKCLDPVDPSKLVKVNPGKCPEVTGQCKRPNPINQGSLTPGPPCWEPGRTAGGERRASERSFICRSPSLALPPEPPLPPPICGKIVFHETGPWCQKGWGPLLNDCLNDSQCLNISSAAGAVWEFMCGPVKGLFLPVH